MKFQKIFFSLFLIACSKADQKKASKIGSSKLIVHKLFNNAKKSQELAIDEDVKIDENEGKEKQIGEIVGYIGTTMRRFAKITPKGLANDGKKVLTDLSPAVKLFIKDAIVKDLLQGLNKMVRIMIIGSFVSGLVCGAGFYIGNKAMEKLCK